MSQDEIVAADSKQAGVADIQSRIHVLLVRSAPSTVIDQAQMAGTMTAVVEFVAPLVGLGGGSLQCTHRYM